MTTLDTATPTTEYVVEEGDHDKEAHIVVPAHTIYEAMVMGTPVTALCGKTWVPTRDPQQFSVCKLCVEVYESTGKKWSGPT